MDDVSADGPIPRPFFAFLIGGFVAFMLLVCGIHSDICIIIVQLSCWWAAGTVQYSRYIEICVFILRIITGIPSHPMFCSKACARCRDAAMNE
jgi:hypothetical protein